MSVKFNGFNFMSEVNYVIMLCCNCLILYVDFSLPIVHYKNCFFFTKLVFHYLYFTNKKDYRKEK